jgi:predicted metal-dependent peptidase
MEAQAKVSRAMTRLVVHYPFFGSIALTLNVAPSEAIPTMATDGKSILWSPAFVDEISLDEVIGVLAHEVMHVVLKHMLRGGNRDPELWNIACDLAINPILKKGGFTLPEGGLFDPQYIGMTAEAIYERLPKDMQAPAGSNFGEVEDAKVRSEAEAQQMEAAINSRVMMAADGARAVGKLPAEIEAMVSKMRQSQVDWRDVLRRFIGGDQPDDYSMRRPNRKLFHTSGIVAPSILHAGAGDIVLGVDTSGSVSNGELSQFLGEMNAISEDMKPRSITVITCDARVQTVRRYEQGEVVERIEVGGRGGTLVSPVFDYIAKHDLPVDNMVYLTDLEVHDFPEQPEYPVLWVASWDDAKPAPWGETTYLKSV